MRSALLWTLAGYLSTLRENVVFAEPQEAPSLQEALPLNVTPPVILPQATCDTWAAWLPPRTDPAVVMQVVSKDYLDVEENFIRLMELNSAFTREHLYLMCMDDESVPFFASRGIRCLPLSTLNLHSHDELWRLRVHVVSCLLQEGHDVIMSDADALWLDDPMKELGQPSVIDSSIVASRGSYPFALGAKWGSTICMGFAMFRPNGAAMEAFHVAMERIVRVTGDDQVAVNEAALELGIVWDEGSDMRFKTSVGFGKGQITHLTEGDRPFTVTLLPHNKYTRICHETPISSETTVAHCYTAKEANAKIDWMREANLWSVDDETP